MRPQRLAALQPSRVSITRALVNRMLRQRWDISIQRFDVDASASGTVVYSIKTPGQEFSFIGFSHPPSRKARTGRIIGRAWDMMGTLNEGPATDADIEAARRELPKLYRGRATKNALVWCRANRSMRVFDYTLSQLAAGRQPDMQELSQVCYLMRNTGLDGNGTFGTKSFPSLGRDHPLGGPLQAQLLTAYLMREYSCDLVEHLARLQSDTAVSLDPAIRRFLGVGNGSALGLIFFVHKHPRLIGSWLAAREKAIASALALELAPADPRVGELLALLRRAATFRRQDKMMYESFASSAQIADDVDTIAAALERFAADGMVDEAATTRPLQTLAHKFDMSVTPEALETFLSLVIELVPLEADALAATVEGADEFTLDPTESVGSLASHLREAYGWALEEDLSSPASRRFVWYKSETAEEPRRGLREEVPEAIDLGLDICGDLQRLVADLDAVAADTPLSRVLMRHPEHRYLTARVQGLRNASFHTPMGNINSEEFTPIDLVRLMNAGLHGIDKTRDFLRRNLRGVLYHGAPTPDEIRAGGSAFWAYPEEPVQ
ncbi:hypothetical protein [Mesorhizobium sp. CAU 1741]|uniref:hypothetical protein n=1 Tax=Mesorhizobium sp. CAU 1741 TaxID=3140366 RepID=UPI00325ABC64